MGTIPGNGWGERFCSYDRRVARLKEMMPMASPEIDPPWAAFYEAAD